MSENSVRCSIYVSAHALEVELLGTAPPGSRSLLTFPSPSFFRLPVAAEYSTKQKIANSHRVAAAVIVVVFISMIIILIIAVIIAIVIHLNK